MIVAKIDENFYEFQEKGATELDELHLENAQLWYEKMRLEEMISTETSALWYEIMTGGSAK